MLKNTDKNILKSKIGYKPGFYEVDRNCAMIFFNKSWKRNKSINSLTSMSIISHKCVSEEHLYVPRIVIQGHGFKNLKFVYMVFLEIRSAYKFSLVVSVFPRGLIAIL